MKIPLRFKIMMLSALLAFIIATGCWYWKIERHETAHVVIDGYFGVKSSPHVYMNQNGFGGYAMQYNFYSGFDNRTAAYIGHAVNEAGYQFTPDMTVGLFFICFATLYYIFSSMPGKEVENG